MCRRERLDNAGEQRAYARRRASDRVELIRQFRGDSEGDLRLAALLPTTALGIGRSGYEAAPGSAFLPARFTIDIRLSSIAYSMAKAATKDRR